MKTMNGTNTIPVILPMFCVVLTIFLLLINKQTPAMVRKNRTPIRTPAMIPSVGSEDTPHSESEKGVPGSISKNSHLLKTKQRYVF